MCRVGLCRAPYFVNKKCRQIHRLCAFCVDCSINLALGIFSNTIFVELITKGALRRINLTDWALIYVKMNDQLYLETS